MKFRTKTKMMTAYWRDIELAASQGTIEAVQLPGLKGTFKTGKGLLERKRDTYYQSGSVALLVFSVVIFAASLYRCCKVLLINNGDHDAKQNLTQPLVPKFSKISFANSNSGASEKPLGKLSFPLTLAFSKPKTSDAGLERSNQRKDSTSGSEEVAPPPNGSGKLKHQGSSSVKHEGAILSESTNGAADQQSLDELGFSFDSQGSFWKPQNNDAALLPGPTNGLRKIGQESSSTKHVSTIRSESSNDAAKQQSLDKLGFSFDPQGSFWKPQNSDAALSPELAVAPHDSSRKGKRFPLASLLSAISQKSAKNDCNATCGSNGAAPTSLNGSNISLPSSPPNPTEAAEASSERDEPSSLAQTTSDTRVPGPSLPKDTTGRVSKGTRDGETSPKGSPKIACPPLPKQMDASHGASATNARISTICSPSPPAQMSAPNATRDPPAAGISSSPRRDSMTIPRPSSPAQQRMYKYSSNPTRGRSGRFSPPRSSKKISPPSSPKDPTKSPTATLGRNGRSPSSRRRQSSHPSSPRNLQAADTTAPNTEYVGILDLLGIPQDRGHRRKSSSRPSSPKHRQHLTSTPQVKNGSKKISRRPTSPNQLPS